MIRPGRMGGGAMSGMMETMAQMREVMSGGSMSEMSEMMEQCDEMLQAMLDDGEGQPGRAIARPQQLGTYPTAVDQCSFG